MTWVQKIFWFVRKPLSAMIDVIAGRICQRKFDGFLSLYIHVPPVGLSSGDIESYFETSDGRHIPVYTRYRYALKLGWLCFGPLYIMSLLNLRNLLSEKEKRFFENAIGYRTLGCSIPEIEAQLKSIIWKLSHLFLPASLELGRTPIFTPTTEELENTISRFGQMNARIFSKLRAFNVYKPPPEASLLEIGYGSGGYSLFAFERMGFRVKGIDDNFEGFEGMGGPSSLPEYLKERIKSDADFVRGDITQVTPFHEASFDIIYSMSVLEHIQDIPKAFLEMYRLLKPGGVLIHGFSSFFAPRGGHSLGILDAPWAHARINEKDYLRYMDELRPHEAEVAKNWIVKGLNRSCAITNMQAALASSGFAIKFWYEKPTTKDQLTALTAEVMADCFHMNPGTTVADLISDMIYFMAVKQ